MTTPEMAREETKAFSLKVYPALEMFATFSSKENGIREYPHGYGIGENALAALLYCGSGRPCGDATVDEQRLACNVATCL